MSTLFGRLANDNSHQEKSSALFYSIKSISVAGIMAVVFVAAGLLALCNSTKIPAKASLAVFTVITLWIFWWKAGDFLNTYDRQRRFDLGKLIFKAFFAIMVTVALLTISAFCGWFPNELLRIAVVAATLTGICIGISFKVISAFRDYENGDQGQSAALHLFIRVLMVVTILICASIIGFAWMIYYAAFLLTSDR